MSRWKTTDGVFTWDVTIPANTTATVYVPTADAALVRESGKQIGQAGEITFLRMESGKAVYTVVSGTYSFQSKL